MKASRIELFAEDHHGVITRAIAAQYGVSTSSWYRAIESGTLEPLHPNVARMAGSPRTRRQAILAAVLGAGPGALASHRTAAMLHGIERPDTDPIDVLQPDRDRRIELDGVVIHHPRDQLDLKRVLRDNIPTSGLLRLLCDLGAVDPAGVSPALGHFVALGTVSPAALERAIVMHSRRGRHGIVAFREALAEWVIDGKPADSVLEVAMRKLLRDYQLPQAEFHAIVAGFEVDFWITGTPVVLECDGWDWHARTRRQFERDTERGSELIAAGFIPVHFTYRETIQRPGRVAQRVRNALTRWSPAAPTPPARSDLVLSVPGIREG